MATEANGAGHGGAARGYRWPTAEQGNEIALRHGARSPRRVEPRAAELVAEIAEDAALAYLQAPAYQPMLRNWSLLQSRAELFGEWLFAQSFEAQLKPPRGGAKSPLDTWLSMITAATRLADRLGLTPLSRSRLARNVVAAEAMHHDVVERLAAEGQAILAERGFLDAVDESGDAE